MPASTDGSLAQADSTQVTTKLAVTSLLHRFREVLVKYVDDEKLSGKCPLPRLVGNSVSMKSKSNEGELYHSKLFIPCFSSAIEYTVMICFRHRIAEISFVLKAIATLLSSLKKAPAGKGKCSTVCLVMKGKCFSCLLLVVMHNFVTKNACLSELWFNI